MWWLVTKKRFRKAFWHLFRLIKADTATLQNHSERITKLESIITMLLREKSQVSSIKKVSDKSETYEQRALKRFKRNKKSLIIEKIKPLLDKGMTTTDLEYRIVKQEKLCSRASFFRYMNELRKSQVLIKR